LALFLFFHLKWWIWLCKS